MIVALATFVCLAYGCVGWGPYAASDYVGTWTLPGAEGEAATLVLREGGAAEIRGVPAEIFALGGYSAPDWNSTENLEGRWETLNGSEIWVTTSLGTTRMWATGRWWGMGLNIVAGGDPDESPTFTFGRG